MAIFSEIIADDGSGSKCTIIVNPTSITETATNGSGSVITTLIGQTQSTVAKSFLQVAGTLNVAPLTIDAITNAGTTQAQDVTHALGFVPTVTAVPSAPPSYAANSASRVAYYSSVGWFDGTAGGGLSGSGGLTMDINIPDPGNVGSTALGVCFLDFVVLAKCLVPGDNRFPGFGLVPSISDYYIIKGSSSWQSVNGTISAANINRGGAQPFYTTDYERGSTFDYPSGIGVDYTLKMLVSILAGSTDTISFQVTNGPNPINAYQYGETCVQAYVKVWYV